MPFRVVNGARLCYGTLGTGPRAVVFIHGGNGGMLSSAWDSADEMPLMMKGNFTSMYGAHVKALADPGRTVIFYDRRCAGASEYTIENFGVDTIALDCVELVRSLGFEKATVVGTSMGGPVSLWIAVHQPAFCQRLVVLNSDPDIMTIFPAKMRAELERWKTLTRAGQRALFDERKMASSMRNQKLVDVDAGGESGERLRGKIVGFSDDELFAFWAGTLCNMAAYFGVDLTPDLARIRCPTLIVHGDSDPVVPYPGATKIRAGVAGAVLHTVAGAKHGIAGHPECQRVVKAWLTERESQASAKL